MATPPAFTRTLSAIARIAALSAVMGPGAACPSLESYYRALDEAEQHLDVAYADDGHPKHRLDLYVPRDARVPFATVVFIHGGYWRAGDKNFHQALVGLYGNVGTALAELGVATAVASYRLHPEASLDDMLDDVVAALVWTRDHVGTFGGDPTALFLAGHSAGAHLVTLLGTHPSELQVRGVAPEVVRGVISLSGIHDIEATIAITEPTLRDDVFVPLFGASAASQRAASPREGFGPRMTPTLFLVGENDYPGCIHDHAMAEDVLADVTGARAFFATLAGNTHEDMVLEIGTARDDATPRMAAFVRLLR